MINCFVNFLSSQHYEKFDTMWNKPGAGAPNPTAIRRHDMDMERHAQVSYSNLFFIKNELKLFSNNHIFDQHVLEKLVFDSNIFEDLSSILCG